MDGSLAVGLPRDLQPMRAALIGGCPVASRGASTASRAIMRRTVTCRGVIMSSPTVCIADAEPLMHVSWCPVMMIWVEFSGPLYSMPGLNDPGHYDVAFYASHALKSTPQRLADVR